MSDPYQLLPELSEEDFQALKADVAERGVLVPVVLDAESGAIIDGHHRVRAWSELKAEGHRLLPYPRDVRHFSSEQERFDAAVSLNLARRHLSLAARRELTRTLRAKGWSLRRIAKATGAGHETIRRDLRRVSPETAPALVQGSDGKHYPAARPKAVPGLFVRGERDETRARAALLSLGPDSPAPVSLARAEEKARIAALAQRRSLAVAEVSSGDSWEIRLGDFAEALSDLEEGSVDAIVTDPPYVNEGLPLYGALGAFAARVLRPGRLAVVYAGHLRLEEEMALLSQGGLSYVWHGVNLLPGQHAKVRSRMVNGGHRSVLLYAKGPFAPRTWINDTAWAEGRGGRAERPLHPWQQALEPARHWVRQVTRPGELVVDPFVGAGTMGLACLMEGRRFLGADIDPGAVAVATERLASHRSVPA